MVLAEVQWITLIPRTEQLGLNTGSVTSFNTCGSSACVLITKRCPFGPFAWTLYCQKNRSFFDPPDLGVDASSLPESGNEMKTHSIEYLVVLLSLCLQQILTKNLNFHKKNEWNTVDKN